MIEPCAREFRTEGEITTLEDLDTESHLLCLHFFPSLTYGACYYFPLTHGTRS